jgi:hypothetical protein
MDETKSQFLKTLIEYPEETATAEYKSAIAFDSKTEFGVKVVKPILGQANAGGGYVVVGFREDAKKTLVPDPALDETVAGSYETTRLCQSVDSYVSEGQRIDLQVHKIEFLGKVYPIISVQGSKEGPLFCCKDVRGADDKLILKEGAIYIRDAAAKTVVVAGAQQFNMLLKLAVEKRQGEIVRQVRSLLDGTQSPSTTPPIDRQRVADTSNRRWLEGERNAAVSGMKEALPSTEAYIEVTHYPVMHERSWSQRELVTAAQKAVCRNTGWPMGVVLTKPEGAPKPLKDGIRATIYSNFMGEMFDYWALNRSGGYFFLRSLAEDTIENGKGKIFFDTRIWDCAEALTHCAALYRELQVPPDTEIDISITHKGIAGRLLSAASPFRFIHWKRECDENESTWQKRVSLGLIEPELEALVTEATAELFILFEFFQASEGVLRSVLQEYARAKI